MKVSVLTLISSPLRTTLKFSSRPTSCWSTATKSRWASLETGCSPFTKRRSRFLPLATANLLDSTWSPKSRQRSSETLPRKLSSKPWLLVRKWLTASQRSHKLFYQKETSQWMMKRLRSTLWKKTWATMSRLTESLSSRTLITWSWRKTKSISTRHCRVQLCCRHYMCLTSTKSKCSATSYIPTTLRLNRNLQVNRTMVPTERQRNPSTTSSSSSRDKLRCSTSARRSYCKYSGSRVPRTTLSQTQCAYSYSRSRRTLHRSLFRWWTSLQNSVKMKCFRPSSASCSRVTSIKSLLTTMESTATSL